MPEHVDELSCLVRKKTETFPFLTAVNRTDPSGSSILFLSHRICSRSSESSASTARISITLSQVKSINSSLDSTAYDVWQIHTYEPILYYIPHTTKRSNTNFPVHPHLHPLLLQAASLAIHLLSSEASSHWGEGWTTFCVASHARIWLYV